MLSIKFLDSIDLSVQAKKQTNRFSRWRPFWISDQNDLRYFYLLVTPMLPVKFQDKWPFVSGKEAKIDFKMAAMAVILDFPSEQF